MLALAMCSLSDTTIMKETAAVLQPASSLGAYVINNALHDMSKLLLSEIQTSISKPWVKK